MSLEDLLMSNKDKQIEVALAAIWRHGGCVFGGTSRSLLRGEVPNDIDCRVSHKGRRDIILSLEKITTVTSRARKSYQGEAYYEHRITTPELQIDVKEEDRWISVTDCDINLVLMYAKSVNLLYVPRHLLGAACPMFHVLNNIRTKQFVPLDECEAHRQYRWKKFEDDGWKNLGPQS